ncbi:helix-turn-helix domain-containing protein [Pseudaestuariivita rosea]|uniref:helix-turn-helix domain-containing protein n=1 Tax=Pseudaestuariivita rosea TaxID=2763263 RepID=UPI001ABAD0DF|nr:helix-turn-helix transcriptional regulator [Pseudaestuariivita rosea]
MRFEEKEELFQLGDISREAIARRLRAGRMATGLNQQDFAKSVGLKKTTYSAQENGDSSPSIPVMRALYREYRIDFNYVLHGDFAQLPSDVQDKLIEILSSF